MPSRHGDVLRESLEDLERALGHLRYSAEQVSKLTRSFHDYSEEDLEKVEAFTSRFSRVVDLLTNKALRALDQFELYDSGTLLDVANRAEKRGLIESVDWLRELKDVRNRVAHDYTGARLPQMVSFMCEQLPRLLEVCDRVTHYGQRRLQEG